MAKPNVEITPEVEAIEDLDRRRSERADVVVRVDYHTVDQIFSDFARNIKEGGMFVETDAPQALGTGVSLQFQLPGSEDPIEVHGRVVRHADGSSHEGAGMGIEFDELDDGTRERIGHLVRSLKLVRSA